MPMRVTCPLGALLFCCVAACATQAPVAPAKPETPAPAANMPGSDRDANGCIPSAGYAWCTRTRQCVRPGELAQKQGFKLTLESFDGYCAKPEQ